jgi:hypothetical protein
MSKSVLAGAALVALAVTAGCGGGGSSATPTTTAISGKVADGYLANAVVFLDKNRNYQQDAGEPSTVTDQQGNFTLQVNPGEIGQYPIVAVAVAGQTSDLDQPGQKVPGSYLLSLPASAVSATSSSFISPISTLIREKMEARGKTLSDAMTELRNQMNLPAGMNVMADYVSLGATNSTDPSRSQYSMMHSTARSMATFMGGEAAKVMGAAGNGTSVDVNRFRAMMGAMNVELPQMVTAIAAMQAGSPHNTGYTEMLAMMADYVDSVPPTVTGMPFRNMSSLFPQMMNGNVTSGSTTRNPGMPFPFRNMTTHFYYGGTPPADSGVVTSGSGMMGSATGMVSR